MAGFIEYDQYDSMILPITKWLAGKGVDFKMGCKVEDLDFTPAKAKTIVNQIHYTQDGQKKEITLNKDNGDLVFVTNGSRTADSRRGTMKTAPILERGKLDGSWTLWENLTKKRSGRDLLQPFR